MRALTHLVRALPLCAVIACRAGESPTGLAERYAQALREDRLRDAYALTSEAFRAEVPFEAFAKRYARNEERLARAGQIQGSKRWRSEESGVIAVPAGEGWQLVEPELLEGRPRETLERFLAAVDAGNFTAAYGQLSGSWRALYTAERFAQDFAAEPSAKDKLARARLAAKGPIRWVDGGAEFPIGDGRAVRLVREGDAFKVAAIE